MKNFKIIINYTYIIYSNTFIIKISNLFKINKIKINYIKKILDNIRIIIKFKKKNIIIKKIFIKSL